MAGDKTLLNEAQDAWAVVNATDPRLDPDTWHEAVRKMLCALLEQVEVMDDTLSTNEQGI
ncbi:MAG: hypothetical protein A3E01_15290 [Gammaproteobacteria bacterium RIFCSPHIGHO2_12_FULL_63_22]|nr:MAG: hypothetical protein A3E01_15290 [Gammaproteobacteria bacterium RIFCSPHIGHO2_12_FULL_63_22]